MDIPKIQDRFRHIKHKVNFKNEKRIIFVQIQILILSGKGGVGKSTMTANLARALAADPTKQVHFYRYLKVYFFQNLFVVFQFLLESLHFIVFC